jgi:hypothetical protein
MPRGPELRRDCPAQLSSAGGGAVDIGSRRLLDTHAREGANPNNNRSRNYAAAQTPCRRSHALSSRQTAAAAGNDRQYATTDRRPAVGSWGPLPRDQPHPAEASRLADKPLHHGSSQARLADARLSGDEHGLAFARLRRLPAPHEQRHLLVAADDRRRRRAQRLEPTLHRARPQRRIDAYHPIDALKLPRPKVFQLEEVGVATPTFARAPAVGFYVEKELDRLIIIFCCPVVQDR